MRTALAALLLALSLLPGVSTAADPLVPVPPLAGLVTDLTQTLSPEQSAMLETRLREFQRRKGSQLAVLVVPTTQPEVIEQYAIRVVDQWKLGRAKVDDGALLLVAKNDRAVRIEVGYGLEGVLTDATSSRVIEELMTPRFRQGDYFGGIDAATAQLIRLIDGEALPEPQPGAQFQNVELQRIAPVLLVIAVVLGGVLRRLLGRMPAATLAGIAVGGIAWFVAGTVMVAAAGALIAFVVTLLDGGGRHLGRYGSWGGHSSGGGFGGGGGGSFGGGGASGRW